MVLMVVPFLMIDIEPFAESIANPSVFVPSGETAAKKRFPVPL